MSAQVTVNEISPTERSFSVEIPQEDVSAAVAKKTAEYHKKVSMPGFRAGHVPAKLISQRFGAAIRQEAMEDVVDEAINGKLRELKLKPVEPGKIEDFADDKTSNVKLTFKFEIDAEIEVKDYADLGIKPEIEEVQETEVEDELHKLQHRLGEEVAVDRAAAEGDVVKGTYVSIVIGGEAQPLAENPEFRMALGTSPLKDLEQGLVGVKAGDEKAVEFTFPADYPNDEIKGKKAVYTVKVGEVLEIRLPEVDDEMAKKVGKKDVKELRDEIRRQIGKYKRHVGLEAAHEKAMAKLVAANSFPVAEARVKRYIANNLKKEEPTEEEIKQGREAAENAIRRYRILDWVANKENIKPKQAEVDEYLQDMANGYGVPFEALKEHLRTSGRMAEIREEMRLGKTMDWLVGERGEAESK
ncbi:MAG: trigger factor [Fibrobacterales bacterium]|nr:trigger factor [Fibrobacterales bacterium]